MGHAPCPQALARQQAPQVSSAMTSDWLSSASASRSIEDA